VLKFTVITLGLFNISATGRLFSVPFLLHLRKWRERKREEKIRKKKRCVGQPSCVGNQRKPRKYWDFSRRTTEKKREENGRKRTLTNSSDFTQRTIIFLSPSSIFRKKKRRRKREMGRWKREREWGENAERSG